MTVRILRHVANRGIVLGLLGFIWLMTGIGLATEPERRLGLADEHIPLSVRAALWILPGVVALVATVWKRLDGWAWPLLILPVGIRFAALTYSWIAGDYPNAWRGVGVYLALALLVDRCAAGLDRPALWDGRERRGWTPAE